MINDIVILAKVYEISEVSNPSAIQHFTIDTPIIFQIINLVLVAREDYLTQKKRIVQLVEHHSTSAELHLAEAPLLLNQCKSFLC